MNKDQLLVCLPGFPGFYNSVLEELIDQELEQVADANGTTVCELHDKCSFSVVFQNLARQWVEAFSHHSGIPLEFESLQSPKEYNFTTDRVFAFIPTAEIERIHKELFGSRVFNDTVRVMFTSYDGFMSYYSNDTADDEWRKPVVEWDHNQLQALLSAYCYLKKVPTDELYVDVDAFDAVQDGLGEYLAATAA